MFGKGRDDYEYHALTQQILKILVCHVEIALHITKKNPSLKNCKKNNFQSMKPLSKDVPSSSQMSQIQHN